MISDKAFQLISIVSIAGVVGICVLHFLAVGRRVRSAGPAGGPANLRRFGFIERMVFLGFALTFLCLAVTGFAPGLLHAGRLSGWLLMAHVGTGGAFIAFLLLLGLFWAEDCRFRPYDAQWSCCCPLKATKDEPLPAGRFDAGQKFSFWAAIALGVVATLTMMVSMLPVFGPEGIEGLRDIHRCCGLAFVLVAFVHYYQTVIVRRGRLCWLISGKVNSDWAKHYHPVWWQLVKGEEGK